MRVYNMALEDFFLDSQVTAWKGWYQRQGYNAFQLSQITTVWVLAYFALNPDKCFPVGYR
jgi:hypothetical protein